MAWCEVGFVITMRGSFLWPEETEWHEFAHTPSSLVADFGQYCYLGMSGAILDTIWFSMEVIS